jgi:hypothetical protein
MSAALAYAQALKNSAAGARAASPRLAPYALRAGATAIIAIALATSAAFIAERSTPSTRQQTVAAASGSKRAPAAALDALPIGLRSAVSSAVGASDGVYAVGTDARGLRARTPAQNMSERFGRGGVLIRGGSSQLALHLHAIGFGASLRTVAPVTPTAYANAVSYAHPGLDEWYRNGPLGLEQGFTVMRAPARSAHGPLTIELGYSGMARASLAADARGVMFTPAHGTPLRYDGVSATDARGRALHTWIALRGPSLLLRVDPRGARYPLRIDPFVQEGGKITGAEEIEGCCGIEFGWSVALSSDGTTALIGGRLDNEYSVGAVWAFTRSGSAWTQQQKLTVTGDNTLECVGSAVALSGDGNTALVGGPCTDADAGGAWIFTRSGGVWTQGERLIAGGEITAKRGTSFGNSVALTSDGQMAMVAGEGDNEGVGAVWTYTRSGETWTQQSELTGSGPNLFGTNIALSADGTTALVTSPGERSVFIYRHSASEWIQQDKLTSTNAGEQFGASVALSGNGNTALIGEPREGSNQLAAVFVRSGEAWSQQAQLSKTGSPTRHVALSAGGNTALIGGGGSVLVYARSGTTWSSGAEELAGSEEVGTAGFGDSVALSPDGGTALVGGPADDSRRGAAWAFGATRPAVNAISPNEGPEGGGTSVTVTGSGLGSATAVRFGSASASFTVNSATSITAVAPPGSGTVDVTVAVGGESSETSPDDRYTYATFAAEEQRRAEKEESEIATEAAAGTPVISRISPDAVLESGATVTLTGSNFNEVTQVLFGGKEATSFTVNSPTSISAVAPAFGAPAAAPVFGAGPFSGANPVTVTVVTNIGASTSTSRPANRLGYVPSAPAPTVTKVKPNIGPGAGATTVKLTGTNFTGATAIAFGSVNATFFKVSSATSITVAAPAEAIGTVNVTVTTPNGTSGVTTKDRYKFAPTITGLSPAQGGIAGGTTVAVTGSGFAPGATVLKFGTSKGTSVACGSSTECTVRAPAHAAGTVDVVATVNKVASTKTAADRFTYG